MTAPDIWHRRMMTLAETIAEWSKDPSTKVGCVIVDDKRRPVSFGFNGFPRAVPDDQLTLFNREKKLKQTIHAETNAILFADRAQLQGSTLYVTLPPCSACAAIIVQSGIVRVVQPYDVPERWRSSVDAGLEIFNHARLEVIKL